jgi:hypothetical protein
MPRRRSKPMTSRNIASCLMQLATLCQILRCMAYKLSWNRPDANPALRTGSQALTSTGANRWVSGSAGTVLVYTHFSKIEGGYLESRDCSLGGRASVAGDSRAVPPTLGCAACSQFRLHVPSHHMIVCSGAKEPSNVALPWSRSTG